MIENGFKVARKVDLKLSTEPRLKNDLQIYLGTNNDFTIGKQYYKQIQPLQCSH